ncbi:hypothetical protein [Streptomyces sp. RFCAC02]|uniref:hypothetical protein n=1 Tax=Streptomyces sp. RFCAC02 TaxID=2499143 RepID=UPI00102281BA|nr:hypothetical protein [Streptomyces sp. RFCAC02]
MTRRDDTASDRYDDFTDDVLPPRRPRPGPGRILGGVLLGLVITAALAGALLLGRPALQNDQQQSPGAPEAAQNG